VEPESGCLKRASGEVTFNIFLGYRFVIGIGGLRGEAASPTHEEGDDK
jgi:hypothetical protein